MSDSKQNVWASGEVEFSHTPYSPFYKDEHQIIYSSVLYNFQVPYEFTGWRDEALSWETSCYIHGNLNPTMTYIFQGSGAKALLSKYCVNTFEKFPVGTGKHCFTCSEDGNITADGVIIRNGEDLYTTYWMWTLMPAVLPDFDQYDVSFEDITARRALLQVGGPRSLEAIEKTFQQDLHDIKFNHVRTVEYKGYEVEVYRMGMAGTLAYELHLPIEFSAELYNDIYEAGKEFGIRRLGLRAYQMQHGMDGCTQFGQHYAVAGFVTPESIGGSMKDMGIDVYFHNPYETGQGFCVKFDHDFVGKEALLKIRDSAHRVMVSLEWNAEDVGDVYASQCTDEPYQGFEGPTQYSTFGIPTCHDRVLNAAGELVGASTGRTYSPYYHRMISICYLEPEYAVEGTDLTLVWGDPGTRQKDIRVKVARFPYFNENPNSKFDVETIPHPVFE